MNTNARLSIGIAAAFVVVAGILLAVNGSNGPDSKTSSTGPATGLSRRRDRPA